MKRAIVIDGNKLGIVLKSYPNNIFLVQYLAGTDPLQGCDMVHLPHYKEAIEADFTRFRVMSHPDYFRELI